VVTLLPLIYFFPATRGNLIIAPDDGVIFNIPIRVAVANLIHAGYVPLWNPYMFSGMPLFGAAQAGVLFPLNWFYLLFSIPVATNLMMLSTYMLAALGAYLYARRSGSSIAGAALTSLVWQWSGFLVAQIGHTNVVHTAALLPWLLWAIDDYGASGKRSRGVLLAAVVAVQVFAGHQQTLVYALIVATAYALVMWRATRQSAPSSKQSRAYLWSLAFIATGLVLAAVQILPTLELLRNSLRADASYDFFTSFSLPPRFLWTFFAPYVMGGGDGQLFRALYVGPAFYGEYVGYVGVATITLAIPAVLLKRDARTNFWAIVVIAGLMLALGRYVPFGFYKLIYFVPVLNLFRVPARHLMEIEFGLAILAGRGLTAIADTRDRTKILRLVLIVSAIVFVLTCLAVTLGRPANFQLGRVAPVSILRAPELFMPIVIAGLSAWALWAFAKRRRRATVLLLLVVVSVDLVVWGQFSGWRLSSPTPDMEVWSEPATLQFLRARASDEKSAEPYRILTEDRSFDPDIGMAGATPDSNWEPLLQPDVYIMYGVENAAGYDGFGLGRYSRLAGDMKVWGELTDADRTLRSESREIDLLNVRYLLAKPAFSSSGKSIPATTRKDNSTHPAADFPTTTQLYGGERFGEEELNLPTVTTGQRLAFIVPPIRADRIAFLTNLSWSEAVPDGAVVARIRVNCQDGQTFSFELRAGEHTSEWAYDRPDIRSRIKHKRAPIGTSYEVSDTQRKYDAHTYVSSFSFPSATTVTGGEITVARVETAPELILSVTRIALADRERSFPLRSEWVKKQPAADTEKQPPLGEETEQGPRKDDQDGSAGQRWRRLAQLGNVVFFENTRFLPRAWLAMGELVATEEEQLGIIRTGKLPGGQPWQPLQTALVEAPTGTNLSTGATSGSAEVTRHEPNRIDVKTVSNSPAILVLSENHYPGWRAYVDGQRVDIVRVNYNQRGVALPAGSHVVEFVYRPKSVLLGLFISLLTLTALLLWCFRPSLQSQNGTDEKRNQNRESSDRYNLSHKLAPMKSEIRIGAVATGQRLNCNRSGF